MTFKTERCSFHACSCVRPHFGEVDVPPSNLPARSPKRRGIQFRCRSWALERFTTSEENRFKRCWLQRAKVAPRLRLTSSRRMWKLPITTECLCRITKFTQTRRNSMLALWSHRLRYCRPRAATNSGPALAKAPPCPAWTMYFPKP